MTAIKLFFTITALMSSSFPIPQASAKDQDGKPVERTDQVRKPKKKQPPFRWVNPLSKGKTYPGVQHHTFRSSSMKIEVGYCIYLPPQ